MAIDLGVVEEEIRKRHGIKISKDDPIMIVVTANSMMQQEALQHHQHLFDDFASKMEVFMTRYNKNATDNSKQMLQEAARLAQDIINQALSNSKQSLQKVVTQSVKTSTADIKAPLEQSIERARLAANTALIAACAAIFAAALVLWASL